jgi:hypothetical protein
MARLALTAAFVGLQAVSGEPVTFAATAALVLALTWSRRVVVAVAVGAMLSAIQTLPLAVAASRSPRGDSIDTLFWSLHPLELAETVVSHLFGHPYQVALERLPWVTGMHSREPLFFSVYIGLGALVLAALAFAAPDRRRRSWFWAAVGLVALVCALGEHTPIYPALQALVPPLQSFRFPVKYLVFCIVALAALASAGADVLLAHARGHATMTRPLAAWIVAGTVAAIAGVLAAAARFAPDAALALWSGLAALARIEPPGSAAQWVLASSTPLFTAVAAVGLGVVILVLFTWQRHELAPVAAAAVCLLAVVDPLLANADVHPTMDASSLGPPAWADAVGRHREDRVYIGGRVRRLPPRVSQIELLDVAERFDMPAELPPQEAVMRVSAQFAYVTAPWGLRETISYDLPELWPREYSTMIDIFRWAPREARLRFVGRTGVRYCYLPEPPTPGAAPVVAPAAITRPMAVYECGRDPRRVYVTTGARVVPDVRAQLELMFDEGHDPQRTVLLATEAPAPAGRPSAPAPAPEARIVRERNTELIVRASAVGNGGYLNVLDSYDPSWQVEVDGEPATLLRANGLYRAVRLAPGDHEVRFTYRPVAFYAGLVVTLATAAALVTACLRERAECRRMRQAVTA